MGILGWLVLGLVAGVIAKALHRGPEPGGLLGTLAVGIGGALVGGLIASLLGIGSISSFFNLGTWLIAIVRSVVSSFAKSTLRSVSVPAVIVFANGEYIMSIDRTIIRYTTPLNKRTL